MLTRTVGELKLVLIWSEERRAWWRPDGLGYTTRVEEAGLYDVETVDSMWIRGNTFHRAVRLGAVAPRQRRGS